MNRASLIEYMRATGWKELPKPGAVGALWVHADVEWPMPVPHVLNSTDPTWELILQRLAVLEGSTAAEVEARIGPRPTDV